MEFNNNLPDELDMDLTVSLASDNELVSKSSDSESDEWRRLSGLIDGFFPVN